MLAGVGTGQVNTAGQSDESAPEGLTTNAGGGVVGFKWHLGDSGSAQARRGIYARGGPSCERLLQPDFATFQYNA